VFRVQDYLQNGDIGALSNQSPLRLGPGAREHIARTEIKPSKMRRVKTSREEGEEALTALLQRKNLMGNQFQSQQRDEEQEEVEDSEDDPEVEDDEDEANDLSEELND